ncbi:hypothetical protein DD771_00430 [Helicobacter pylori]|nr:hypothetical protein DD771_00430 [Helicobacter pylori]
MGCFGFGCLRFVCNKAVLKEMRLFEWGVAIKKGVFNFDRLVCYKKDFFFRFVVNFVIKMIFLRR